MDKILKRIVIGLILCIGTSSKALSDDSAIDSSVGKNPFPPSAFEVAAVTPMTFFTPMVPPLETPGDAAFYVHSGKHSTSGHYVPSGWMGDYGDLRLSNSYTENPSHSNTCLRITYSGDSTEGFGWAGIYWQNPGNNWGNLPGGYNLRGMHRLIFWARGENGGEVISVFKIGGIEGYYHDSDSAQIGPVHLTKEWKEYTIDLTNVDLSRVIGGFAWATGRKDNDGPITFYLDAIRYEP